MVVSVIGKLPPETVKPLPVTLAALMVTAALPVDVKISVCVAGEFRFTLPKAIVVAFTLSVATAAPSCRAKVFAKPPALAVSVTVCAALTADTVAVKLAVAAPAATVTLAGTATAELLLARLTANPPLGAAALSVTAQLSVPAPVIDELVQLRLVKVAAPSVVPLPLRPIAIVPFFEALLVIVSFPAAAPVPTGEKLTLKVYLPPAATEIGRLPSPLIEKACPDTLMRETFTAPPPVFVREMLALATFPIDTPPKLTALRDACRDPVLAAAPTVSPPNENQIKMHNKRN